MKNAMLAVTATLLCGVGFITTDAQTRRAVKRIPGVKKAGSADSANEHPWAVRTPSGLIYLIT
ncbi:MAG: hypothetical protein ABR530_06795 [Pyrinomonadaceae bacterium]